MPASQQEDDPTILDPVPAEPEDGDEVDEQQRLEAERLMPSRARLEALIALRKPSPIHYDDEPNELPW